MKDVCYLCLFLIGFSCFSLGCSSQEIKRSEVKLKIIRKIQLNTEDYYPNVSTRAYGIISNANKSYFDIIAPNLSAFIRYDTTGKIVRIMDKSKFGQNYELPSGFPAGFDFIADTLCLLYPTNNTIYKIVGKNIVAKIQLQIPKNYIIARGTPLYCNKKSPTCIISIGKDVEKAKDFFPESRPLAIFDLKTGNLLKEFGNYPTLYAQGATIMGGGFGFLKTTREEDKIFLQFPHFDKIDVFDEKGNLLKNIQMPYSIYRDSTLRISNKLLGDMSRQEIAQTQNDTYRGGLAKTKGKNIFFRLYFSHKKLKEVLTMYDTDTETYQEAILPLELHSCHLFPVAYGKSCFLLSMNPQSDEVYIYEVAFE
jgi:hypothetical protein